MASMAGMGVVWRQSVLWGLWLAIAGAAAFLATDIVDARHAATQQALFQVSSYVRLVGEHATAVLDRTNSVLTHAVDSVPSADLDPAKGLSDERRTAIEAKLAGLQREAFGVVSMSLTDADGRVLANTVGRPPGDDLGDRAYFLQLKAANSDAPVISETIKGRVSNKWGVQIARRVRFPDGRFAGMIVANVGVGEVFASFYESLELSPGASIFLKDAQDRLLVRYPAHEDFYGKAVPVPDDVVVARQANGDVVYHRVGILDGIPKLFAMRRLARYDLTATVGMPDDTYLSAWRYLLYRDVALLAVMLVGGAIATLDLTRRARAERQLHAALDQLKAAQHHLVQSEKLAALGQLVAGVAHEINTPIGVAVTASSMLLEHTGQVKRQSETEGLRRRDFNAYMALAVEATEMIQTNLDRAADLVQSFKQVATDRVHDDRRRFALRPWLDELVTSLAPVLRKAGHRLVVECPEDLEIGSYPGALGQVITNLVMNSLDHAYDAGQRGELSIQVRALTTAVELIYSDDGRGIPAENRTKVFDPFFTTRRATGNTGLGLHIVHNLVTARLGGTIAIDGQAHCGVRFTLRLPL